MSNVKNFGIIGVGAELQFSKAGPKIKQTTGAFSLRNAGDTADAALTLSDLTVSTGNISLSATGATITIGTDTTLSRNAAGVFRLNGTKAVIIPTGTDGDRPTGSQGMFRYNTTGGVLEYHNGSSWISVTAGGAAVTAVSVVSANGFAGTSSGGTTPALTLSTTITGILQGNGTAISAATTTGSGSVVLATSPSLTTPSLGAASATSINGLIISTSTGTLTLANGSSLVTSGANSITLTSTGTTAVTLPTSGTLLSTANIASNAVTSFSAGTTGFSPNTATNGAITLSGTLVAANGGTGLSTFGSGSVLYASAANTWAAAAPGATSGVQAYNANLDALAGLSSTGLIARTGAGTAAVRTITGTSGRISVTNGSGVSGDPTIDLATVSQASSGSFVKVTIDSYGRISGNTAVVANDITSLVDSTYVNVSGDTMTGTLTMSNSATITGIPTPVNSTDAANKAYVDNAVTGMSWKQAVSAATVTSLTATYNNGSSGVGATLTNSGTQAAFAVDGYTASVNDRILVKNQGTQTQNGIYIVTNVGSGSTNWVLTRSTDADTTTELNGASVYVRQGSTNADTGWTQTAEDVVIGTNNIVFAQFSGSNTYVAGTGISITGNTIANTGVTQITAGTNISVSGSTGNVTVNVSGTVPSATNIAGGTTGQVPYQSAAGTTAFVTNAAGVLQAASSGATPTWTTSPTLTGTNFSGIPNGALTNSSVTIGTTSISLGSSSTSLSGLTGLALASGTVTNVPTPTNNTDAANKSYVDTSVANAAPSGSIKAFRSIVSMTGSAITLGTIPSNSTVLRVKVDVTAADSGSGTLVVGKTGTTNAYMLATENDPQSTGLYVAETMVTEGSSVSIIATPSGATSGSATVLVEYQVA